MRKKNRTEISVPYTKVGFPNPWGEETSPLRCENPVIICLLCTRFKLFVTIHGDSRMLLLCLEPWGIDRFDADRTHLQFRGFRNWIVAGAGEDVHRHIAETETGEDRATR